ncbi:MAG: 5'/3'-nucleotidase SurE [Saprospiraceae bacterium]|uniref:5'-nucleotidase SurE n=1 Tax=Candidatus Opimibacter skivensis TaxID=2982028 RepID=A0A9D7SVY2_9BACT|nr:5'/3'-nucleotidase SurE [Candidatus Opimibacter skivensis]
MHSKRPLILVTNDDGMFAPGIRRLVAIASEMGEVIVVAPNSPQSAKGHAITMEDPIRLHKVDAFKGIEAYECSGTPVDCVKLAKNVLLKNRKIDLCVSGINHGSNSSISILYSGTISAAMEAAIEGINSIGFSLDDYSMDADFDPATPWVRSIMQYVLINGIEYSKLLNVNIPHSKNSPIKGTLVCRQSEGRWEEEFMEGLDPRGQKFYWLTGKFVTNDAGPGTDIYALRDGYISIVPSLHDLTSHQAIPGLKSMELLNPHA